MGATLIVNIREVLKPIGMSTSVIRLRNSRPAPTSSTSDNETSASTRLARAKCRWPSPVDPRVLSFSVLCSSGRDACQAGTTPNSTPVASESNSANPSA